MTRNISPEALAAIGEQQPDLVFLDVQMPELDGFGVLEQLRRGAMPAIVFITAHDRFALRVDDQLGRGDTRVADERLSLLRPPLPAAS